jgi:hypothetical protein
MSKIAEKLVNQGLTLAWQAEVLVRAKFKCEYCKTSLLTEEGWFCLHWDHLTPKSKGGGDGPENQAASCSPCNTFKNSFDPASAIEHPNPSREEKVEAARKYIEHWKNFYRDRLNKIREAIASEQEHA